MSKILEAAILGGRVPGATRVHFEGEYVYVEVGEASSTVIRYRLSPEALRIALLEREGRPLDIPIGEVTLLVPEPADEDEV